MATVRSETPASSPSSLAANQELVMSRSHWAAGHAPEHLRGKSVAALGKQLDLGLSSLIADLKASGDFADTMIVMAGEFGRTVGKLTGAAGRDHLQQQFAFFAGGVV